VVKVNIYDIPEEGLTLDVEEEGKNLAELAGPLDFTFRSPVKARLELIRSDGNVVTSGEMSVILGFTCGRCLKEFERPVSSEFRLFSSFADAGRAPRDKDEADDEGVEADMDEPTGAHVYGDSLDVTEMLLEQIALEAPMQPLCSEACKGLCPRCGTDLNVTTCDCRSDARIDSRFAKLKDFKSGEK
jgi:uncharacterized protein